MAVPLKATCTLQAFFCSHHPHSLQLLICNITNPPARLFHSDNHPPAPTPSCSLPLRSALVSLPLKFSVCQAGPPSCLETSLTLFILFLNPSLLLPALPQAPHPSPLEGLPTRPFPPVQAHSAQFLHQGWHLSERFLRLLFFFPLLPLICSFPLPSPTHTQLEVLLGWLSSS